MELFKTLVSNEDKSVNFIFNNHMEARFVQRSDDYFIIYLSSQTGCNKSCRFCHLTQTGQIEMLDADIDAYNIQLQTVLNYSKNILENKVNLLDKVHINFMARGEVFANNLFLKNSSDYLLEMSETIWSHFAKEFKAIKIIYNLSTIMPLEIESIDLDSMFIKENFDKDTVDFRVYYSLYSMNPEFRKKWLPKALDPKISLDKLLRLQNYIGCEIKLHCAFIEGENDSFEELEDIIKYCRQIGLNVSFNIVRYNPYSSKQGVESSKIYELENYLKTNLGDKKVHMIPRVGKDVYASCGTFLNE